MMKKSKNEHRRTVWDILQNNMLLDSVVYARAGQQRWLGVIGFYLEGTLE